MEIWKPIPGSRYEASSLGRVRSTRILAPKTTKFGYLATSLRIGRKWVHPLVHVLVAAAWIGPKKNGLQVNHKDCNKKNNTPKNLEYVTRKENAAHAVKNGRYVRGSKHYRATLNPKEVKHLRQLRLKGYTCAELALLFSVSRSTAYKIAKGDTHA